MDQCPTNFVYRSCLLGILHSYAAQGVVGVRFQFGMGGYTGSNPFTDPWGSHDPHKSGSLSAQWLNNLALLFQDIRGAGIRYVTLTPDTDGGLGGAVDANESLWYCFPGPTLCSDPTINRSTPDIVFFPWLPYGVLPSGGVPFNEGDPSGYYSDETNSPYFPPGWRTLGADLRDSLRELSRRHIPEGSSR